MRKSRITVVGAIGIAAALALSACSGGGSGSSGSSDGTIGKVDGKGKTITVWVMTGDLTPKTLDAINTEFTKETGAKVKVETQQWTNIATKITTALATSTPPDVLDIGNTQVATFASSGGLLDLTKYKSDLEQGQTWLGGLVEPATVNGKLYGVPSFGAARAVVYNKDIWSKAGITAAPTTYDQLKADLDKVKAAGTASDFSSFYLPGQYWYAGLQWMWDAGGDIATLSDGKWKAGFSSSDSQKGLTEYKAFQNAYSSTASQSLNTDKPDQDQLFADGKAGAILANNWELAAITKDNPSLTNDKLGSFPLPGASGKNQPALLAGSDWGIAQKSKNQDLALVWSKIAASPKIQNDYVFGNDKWIPNSVEGSKSAVSSGKLDDNQTAFFTAAQNSKATPASGNWAQLEDPGMKQFFQSIATGSKSVADATKAWDDTVNSTLNG
ncbi:sugar ABC transporter substrate-binding protein [Leifsonia poae]|uniref:sugar ABC transporter substrate-binding protein n=1 Tax=Leifsonia poae TaxID=110933 RepID=UPI001CC0B957|nr:sugar ABC transporter substrate-binding protein [Leifsonia poae]